MKFRVDKVKKVLKGNSREYYDYLDKLNRNIMNMRKKDIKENRDSVLEIKNNENKFEIRELPDNPGSNFSSVKKDSHIREDLQSEMHISSRNMPVELKDFSDFAKQLNSLTEVMNNLRGYFGFEMSETEILDFIRAGRPTLDESYQKFMGSYNKCFSYGESGPNLADKTQAGVYDWERLRTDCNQIRQQAQTFYENIKNMTKSKPGVSFKDGKETVQAVDLDQMADFVLEKYKKTGQTELFESTVKEKKDPGKSDFNFDMSEMGDVFAEAKKKDPKPTSFGLEQTNDAFEDFNNQKENVPVTEEKGRRL